MSLWYYGILIIFGLFLLILIFSPSLSCFGKRLKSPLYPLFRRKKKKTIKTEDYGFSLVSNRDKQKVEAKEQKVRTEGDGFSRVDDTQQEPKMKKKKMKTHDYGFSLVDDEGGQEPK